MHLDFVKNASMKVDAFEHLEVTHHRNLGISRTSLVMSRQVVDKELHQIQSAAETTLCGSPLLLACTEPWTSMDFRGLSDFSIKKKPHKTHTVVIFSMTTLDFSSWRITAQCDDVTHTEPQCVDSVKKQTRKVRDICQKLRCYANIFFDIFVSRYLPKTSTRCFLQSFRAFRVILVHQGMSWGVLIAEEFVGAKQARGIFSNFAHKNC